MNREAWQIAATLVSIGLAVAPGGDACCRTQGLRQGLPKAVFAWIPL